MPSPNCCLKLTACGTFDAPQNSPVLARRSLTMRYAIAGPLVDIPSVRLLSVIVLSLGWAVSQSQANSAATVIVRPALANTHNLIVSFEMVPFATYPSQESESFESKIRAEVEARLTKDGFAIVKGHKAPNKTPELTISVDSSRNEECPSLVALHMRLTLRDSVTLNNRRIGRFEDNVVLWEWWGAGGEVSIVEGEEVSSAVEDWVNEAITAFVKDVKYAAVSSQKPGSQK
jgi:hypothetical protein